MSKQALERFRTEVSKNQALRGEMAEALGPRDGKPRASVNELVAFAGAHGFEFSAGELAEELELRDEELDKVSGGAIYMKYDGVKGESSSQDRHKDWIEVLSYSF